MLSWSNDPVTRKGGGYLVHGYWPHTTVDNVNEKAPNPRNRF